MGSRDHLDARDVLYPGLSAGLWVCPHCENSLSCIFNNLC